MAGANTMRVAPYRPNAALFEFAAVVQNGTQGCKLAAANGDMPLGVAIESCTAADVTNERVLGIMVEGNTFAVAGAAIAIGAVVMVATTGKVLTLAGVGARGLGIARSAAAADGDYVLVDLQPGIAAAP